MHECTTFLLPWGSLVAMEFSDPETNPSPNQLAVIHMHILELLITDSNYTSHGGVSSLKIKQTERNQKCPVNTEFSLGFSIVMSGWRSAGRLGFKISFETTVTVCCISVGTPNTEALKCNYNASGIKSTGLQLFYKHYFWEMSGYVGFIYCFYFSCFIHILRFTYLFHCNWYLLLSDALMVSLTNLLLIFLDNIFI